MSITETTASDLASVKRRARKGSAKAIALLVASVAATVLAVSASAADRFVPGVPDFPSASRSEPYVPFVTDFPSRTPGVATADDEAHTTHGVDGLYSAVAVAGGLALLALAAASRPALRRRRSMSSA